VATLNKRWQTTQRLTISLRFV